MTVSTLGFKRTALGAAVGIAMTGTTVAQNASSLMLEEVVVTAQKRSQSLQDVPISVSAVSGERMRDTQITNLESLTTFVPNFSMNQSGISNNITIRGVSSGINPGFEQSVGMYVDEIYYGRGQLARSPLFDLERIEVLRGPQPIIFGKNAIAGAINIVTAKPSDEFEGFVTALYESEEDTQDYRLAFSGPITDTLSGRISALARETQGAYENTFTGNNDKFEDESVVRAQLRWEPSDTLSVNFKVEHSEFDDRGRNVEVSQSIVREDLPAGVGIDHISAVDQAVFAGNNPDIIGLDPQIPYSGIDGELNRVRGGNLDFHNNESDAAVLAVDWDLGGFSLTSTTGFLQYEFTQNCDCDFSSALIFNALATEEFEQFSQEFRLSSPGGETVDYTLGVYFQSNELNYQDAIDVPEASLLRVLSPAYSNVRTRRFADQESDTWAGFAQLTWNVTDAMRLILGGRYTNEEKTATKAQQHFAGPVANEQGFPATDPEGGPSPGYRLNPLFGAFNIEPYDQIQGSRDESQFTPQVTLQYDLSDDTMIYATYVEGFKAGGFDIRSNAHPDPAVVNAVRFNPDTGAVAQDLVGVFEFEDEKATNYEIGIKAGIGQTAEINFAAFYTEYDDLQTSQFDGVLGFNVANAGKAEIRGFEADGRWLVSEGWTVSANFAYLDFEYKEFPNNQVYFGMAADVFGEANLVNDADGPNPQFGPSTYDASGKRKEYTPEFTGGLSLEWVLPLGDMQLRSVYDANYSDSYLFNPTLDPRSEQDAFVTHNLRVGFGPADGTWEIAFIGKNLSDEDIVTYGGEVPLAGSLTEGTGMSYYKFLDRPATYALQGSYRF